MKITVTHNELLDILKEGLYESGFTTEKYIPVDIYENQSGTSTGYTFTITLKLKENNADT